MTASLAGAMGASLAADRLVDETRPRLAVGLGVFAAPLGFAIAGNVGYWKVFGYWTTLFLVPTAAFVVVATPIRVAPR